MRNIGLTLWLIFGVMMLGWYGLAMLVVGVVLYIVGYLIKCSYEERKAAKRREEGLQ